MPTIKVFIFLPFFFLPSVRINQTNETINYPGDVPQCMFCEVIILGVGGSPAWWVHALLLLGAKAGIVVTCYPSLNPGKQQQEGR